MRSNISDASLWAQAAFEISRSSGRRGVHRRPNSFFAIEGQAFRKNELRCTQNSGGKGDGKAERQGGDTIAEAVTADIMFANFGDGTWLKQVGLEARYQCTRGDVRRALEKLAVKGASANSEARLFPPPPFG